MVNSHICAESCFNARNSDKMTIKCFLCGKAFNAKCFDMNLQPTVKLLASGNNAVFMCHKCIDRVSRMKQSTRRLTDTNRSGSPSNENEMNMDQQSANNNEEKVTLESMMTILRQINESFAELNNKNVESEMKTVNQKLTDLHAKIDHQGISRATAESKTSSLLLQGMKDLQDKIVLPSSYTTKVSPNVNENGTPRAVNVIRNKGALTMDPLNWSFSFSQSTLPNDNVDLYQLLNGFEQNTWTSLDYLRHKLNENTDTVTSIESICKDLKTQIGQHHMASPLTKSIELENLQAIQDKCEAIEQNLRILESTMHKKSVKSPAKSKNNMENHERTCNTPHAGSNNGSSIYDGGRTQQVADQFALSSLVNEQNALDQEIYVSKLPISTTCEDIREYISHQMPVNATNMKIHRLTKKNQDISKLSFISFKIETNEEFANQLIKPEFWPNRIIVNWWKRKVNQISSLNVNANHFLSRATTNNQKP